MTTDFTRAHSRKNTEMLELYKAAGFSGRVGWGKKPAVLVIDMAGAWTAPDEELGSNVDSVLESTISVVEAARAKSLPIIYTTMAYDPEFIEAGPVTVKKTPHAKKMLRGSERVQLHPALKRLDSEPLVEKPHASAFFGTNVLSMLIGQRVDTVIVVGVSTSGCIRSTCESGFNNNFHVIVPEEAVGDRSYTAHEAALLDIDARMGDVMPLTDVTNHLENL